MQWLELWFCNLQIVGLNLDRDSQCYELLREMALKINHFICFHGRIVVCITKKMFHFLESKLGCKKYNFLNNGNATFLPCNTSNDFFLHLLWHIGREDKKFLSGYKD